MPKNRFGRDEAALGSSVVAFLVAGIIFVGSIGAVLVMTRSSGTGVAASTAPAAALNGQAKSLTEFLLDSPGVSSTGGDWAANGVNAASSTPSADTLTRLGLKDSVSSDPHMLNFSKFENLRMAPYAANPTDGYVNYEEARAGLGLANAGLDFHIRAYPTLKTVQDILRTGRKDPNLAVTYIGNVGVSKTHGQPPPANPTANLTVGAPSCAVSPLIGSDYRLSVRVTNGGQNTTQFNGLFTYKLGDAASESQGSDTFLVPAGQSATLYIDVPALTWTSNNGHSTYYTRCTAGGSTITVDVRDPATAHVQVAATVGTAVTGASTVARDIILDSYKTYFVNANGATSGCSDPVKASWSVPDGVNGDKLALKVVNNATGAQVFPATGYSTWTIQGNGNNGNGNPVTTGTVTIGCLPAGNYLGTLYSYTGSNPVPATDEQVTENLLVATASVPAYLPPSAPAPTGPNVYTPTKESLAEVGFLDTLVQQFCPTYFDGTTSAANYTVNWSTRCSSFATSPTPRPLSQPGDVFPDSKDILDNDLHDRLIGSDGKPRYDLVNVLVAGSNVDQTAMTSSAAKDAVRDWVLGGGTLIVFGSTAQNVNWLEPIFHAAIQSSSGGLSVPDPGHPILHSADELDYPHYVNGNRTWSFNGQTAQDASKLFTNVVVQGSDPVTTESNAGAMGKGSVILTTWMPDDLYGGSRDAATTQAEGLKFVNNLLMQGYRDLFLDYGPSLPPNTNVIPAIREMEICHPGFLDAQGKCDPIQLSIVIFVFK